MGLRRRAVFAEPGNRTGRRARRCAFSHEHAGRSCVCEGKVRFAGAGKERPDIYLAAAKALGTHPADTWVFEDALYAIKTAKAAGFYTVGLYDETSRNDQEAIAGLADCYVREIQSVPTQDCT